MRKFIVILGAVALLNITGCGQESTSESIYDETPAVSEETSQDSATVEETETSTEVDGQDEQAGEEDTDTSSQESETVSEDVYESSTEEVSEETSEEVISEPTSVDDPAFKVQVQTFVELFYYNLFFPQGDYSEGIKEEDMVKFAISYIYQHAYNELKFDTKTFTLYVPEENVEDMVERYFDERVSGHHSFEEEQIPYENGDYLMPAVDTNWKDQVVIDEIIKSGDFSYEVDFSSVTPEGEVNGSYQAQLELREGRLIMTGFDAQVNTTEEEEATTSQE